MSHSGNDNEEVLTALCFRNYCVVALYQHRESAGNTGYVGHNTHEIKLSHRVEHRDISRKTHTHTKIE